MMILELCESIQYQNISKFIKDIKTGFSKQKHDDGDDNQDEDGNLDDDFCDYDNDDILE